jgi:small subunit ribosomal protein S13
MPRVAGVDIPNNKKVWCALTYIHGIGKKTAYDLCDKLGIDPNRKAHELTQDETTRLAQTLDADHVIEGTLRRTVQTNIQRLKDISCYRGLRHRRSLPVKGQRTRTNARTRKGKKRTVAVKKSVKAL